MSTTRLVGESVCTVKGNRHGRFDKSQDNSDDIRVRTRRGLWAFVSIQYLPFTRLRRKAYRKYFCMTLLAVTRIDRPVNAGRLLPDEASVQWVQSEWWRMTSGSVARGAVAKG